MQYEGVAVMKMFDKAKVNVNLLIFLLNKKFYGKWVSSDIVDYIHQWEVSSVFFFFLLFNICLMFVIGCFLTLQETKRPNIERNVYSAFSSLIMEQKNRK